MPVPNVVDSYIDREFAALYAAAIDAAPYNALYERPAMLELLPPVGGRHILDAGCGGGWYAEELLRRDATVTAIDASPGLVEHTRLRLSRQFGDVGRWRIVQADLAEPLAFLADSVIDGIIAPLVLHYIRDWRPTMREFRRVLRPGGWLLLSTHHPSADAARYPDSDYLKTDLVEDDWKWLGKVRFFRRSLTEVASALTDEGFVIDRLIEAIPTDAFRAIKPESYRRVLRNPEFLMVRAITNHV